MALPDVTWTDFCVRPPAAHVIRLTLLWLVILGILGYTWKDWYRGICAPAGA